MLLAGGAFLNINQLEACTFLLPRDPANFNIIIHTDNLSSQNVLNSGYGKDELLCACARQF